MTGDAADGVRRGARHDDPARAGRPCPGRSRPQRVGGGSVIRSPGRIVAGSVICGFSARTVRSGTPNQAAMLCRLSPARIV